MTHTSIIITESGDTGDLVCPICGAHSWDRHDVFARCHRCGSEVTVGEAIGLSSEPGCSCPECECRVKRVEDHDR